MPLVKTLYGTGNFRLASRKTQSDLASEVIKGASEICKEAGVIIAGGDTN
jgi:phosphoribosylaminoimidazole (AIR) synthetase